MEPPGIGRDEADDPALEPLRASDPGGLRFFLQSRFTRETLRRHLSLNPGLSWRVVSSGQYVVGGFWRRRPEIAAVVELDSGPFRRALLERLIAAARGLGCELVVAELSIPAGEAAGWSDVGFEPVDTIHEYEKPGTAYEPLAAPPPPIRRYRPDDLRPVLALEARSFPWLWRNSTAELAHYAEAHETELWVLERAGALIGYVGLTIRGDHGHLDRLAVDPDRRQGGLGSGLVAAALDRFAARRVRRITLTTQHDNVRAQPIYRRFGFRPTGGQLTIYGRWLGRPRDRTP
jgi:[ribosomal protein S18]-alanine N-acetyltransferase